MSVNQTHPDYELVADVRKQAVDLFEGARTVKPLKTEYLFQDTNEKQNNYDLRHKRASFDPFAATIMKSRQGNLFGKTPTREISGSIADLLEDVDASGTPASVFFERVACKAQVSGMDWVLISKPSAKPVEGRSKQTDIEEGRRVTFKHIPGASVINWGADDHGQLEWAVILGSVQTEATKSDTPWSDDPEFVAEWRVWTRNEWMIFREGGETNSEFVLHKEGRHNLGVVPLVPFYGAYDGPFIGWSVLEEVITHIVQIYNQESDKDWSLKLAGHAIPYVTGANKLDVLDSGQGIFIEQQEGQPTPQIGYLETSGKAPEALAASIENLTRRIYANALNQMLRNSAQVQSADGQREDRKARNSSLRVISIALESSETRCWEIAALCEGQRGAKVDIQYIRDFDDTTIEAAFITALSGLVDRKILDKLTSREILIEGDVTPDGLTAEEIGNRVTDEMIAEPPPVEFEIPEPENEQEAEAEVTA